MGFSKNCLLGSEQSRNPGTLTSHETGHPRSMPVSWRKGVFFGMEHGPWFLKKRGVFFSFYLPWILGKGVFFHNACGGKNVELFPACMLRKGDIFHKVCHAKVLRFFIYGFLMGIFFS